MNSRRRGSRGTPKSTIIFNRSTMKSGLKKTKNQPRLPKKGSREREEMPASFVQYIKGRHPMVNGWDGKASSKKKPIVVSHEELFFTVAIPSADGTYKTLNSGNGFPIQPGTNVLFPWLSSLAQNFEQYRFRRFCVRYYTRVGTTTSGELTVLVDTDVNDPAAGSQVTAMSFDDRMNGPAYCEKPREFHVLSSDLHPDGPRKFVRTVNNPSTNDAKTFDCGNVWVAAEGYAASTAATWGYLTVDYEVELWKTSVPLTVSSVAGFGWNSWVLTPSTIAGWVALFGGLRQPGSADISEFTRDIILGGSGQTLAIGDLTIGQVYEAIFQIYAPVGPTSVTGPMGNDAISGGIGYGSLGAASGYGNTSAGAWATLIRIIFQATASVVTLHLLAGWTNTGGTLGTVPEVQVRALPGFWGDGILPFGLPRPLRLDLCSSQTRYALEVMTNRLLRRRHGSSVPEEALEDLWSYAIREAAQAQKEQASTAPRALQQFQ